MVSRLRLPRQSADARFARNYRLQNRSCNDKYHDCFICLIVMVFTALLALIAYDVLFIGDVKDITIPVANVQSQISRNSINYDSTKPIVEIESNTYIRENNTVLPQFPTITQFAVIETQNKLSITDRQKIPSLTTPFGDINVVYRIYQNHACNDNDKNSYITFTTNANINTNTNTVCLTLPS